MIAHACGIQINLLQIKIKRTQGHFCLFCFMFFICLFSCTVFLRTGSLKVVYMDKYVSTFLLAT